MSPTVPVLPDDAHNQDLVRHVHPPDWVNPDPADRYHLLVIGGGPAGLVTAAIAAGLGAKVALVEKHLLGGDCLNVGCVPSKSLIRCARAGADVRDAETFGVRVPAGAAVDFPVVMARMRRLRAGIGHHDAAARFRELGIDVFLGEGRFTGPDKFAIDDNTLRFKRACVATGARAATPSIPGLADLDYLTNETVFSLTELPRRLAVIGAGPIGCELSQTFARFGSQVYLIEARHGVLPNDDPDAAAVLEHALREQDGVQLMCCGKNLTVHRTDEGTRLAVDSHDTKYELTVDQVLVSAGRAPNVEGLGLEQAGVAYDKTGIQVNERLQTSNRRIFAAGDVCFPYKFTHTADALARIVVQNALFFGRKKTSALTIPWCTYTDPEIAHVGLRPQDAEAKGIPCQTIRVDLSSVDRAILDGETDGFLKVHVGQKGRILGATLVARHAGDLISELAVAMAAGMRLGSLSNVIHPYPTQAEIIKKAGDQYNRSRFTPRVAALMKRYFAWT